VVVADGDAQLRAHEGTVDAIVSWWEARLVKIL